MDIAQLKSYYKKPNTNSYSIDFILGYKRDRTQTDSKTDSAVEASDNDSEDIDIEETETEKQPGMDILVR